MVWAPAGFHSAFAQLEMDQWAVILAVLALGLILKAVILWWLYRDLTARGREPWGWLIAAFLLDIPTLIVWLIVRERDTNDAHPDDSRADDASSLQTPPRSSREDPAQGDDPVDPDVPVGPRAFKQPETAQPPLTHVTPPDAPSTGKRILVTCPYCSTQFTTLSSPTEPTAVTCPSCGERGVVPEQRDPL